MNFQGKAESPKAASKPPKKKLSVASVFNCDSSEVMIALWLMAVHHFIIPGILIFKFDRELTNHGMGQNARFFPNN